MDKREKIVSLLSTKSVTKQIVYHNAINCFNEFKIVLSQVFDEIKKKVSGLEKEIKIELNDKSAFETELIFGGDVLIFSIHTNVFSFNQKHHINDLEYVKADKSRSYCGVIHIYNFLADSLKYSRQHDIGYLIGRIFINKEYSFFIEGKRELGFLFNHFGNKPIDQKEIRAIIESAILYTLEFDLLSPPYDSIHEITVFEKDQQSGITAIKTGKRVGFKFSARPED